MEFVSLTAALTGIANCVELGPHGQDAAVFADPAFASAVKALFAANNAMIEQARRVSIAALLLNKSLHHPVDSLPLWLEYDQAKRFAVKNDEVAAEGIAILTDATSWGGLLLESLCTHVREASAGYRRDQLDPDFVRRRILAVPAVAKRRPMEIGFDRADLIRFLDACQILHELAFAKQPALPKAADRVGQDSESTESAPEPEAPEWVGRAVDRGWEIVREAQLARRAPSQEDIASQIAREWAEARVLGKNGSILSAATVKRQALTPFKVSCKAHRLQARLSSRGK